MASTAKFGADDVHVQEVIHSAQSELRVLMNQKAELMRRIGSIKQTLTGMASMFGESLLSEELLALLDRKPTRHSGFTRACRSVLMESAAPLKVREVCDLLRRKFPGLLERHREPIASVTTVLSRLVAYDEARTFLDGDGKRVWQWTAFDSTPIAPIIPSLRSVIEHPRNQA